MFKMLKKNEKGFTLIELLIVIGLLGALTSLVLPSLMADRTEALLSVCDYNQAGTVRTLHQYKSLMGGYPDGMHTGLTSGGGTPMGLPEYTLGQYNDSKLADYTLVATDVQSLQAAGIDELAWDEGYHIHAISTASTVMEATDAFEDDSDTGTLATFDGRDIATHKSDKGGEAVIALFIAPTVDWDSGAANSWAAASQLEMGIDLEGKCPIPTGENEEFTYYIAYFMTFTDGSEAELLGTSCPECGIMNP
jgi:prepilin-type N-terminal cleavage/methylation domain-containing protein